MVVDAFKAGELFGGLRDDPFPGPSIRDMVAIAVVVHQFGAGDAELGFEGAGRVVEACVYHLLTLGSAAGGGGGDKRGGGTSELRLLVSVPTAP